MVDPLLQRCHVLGLAADNVKKHPNLRVMAYNPEQLPPKNN